MVVSVRVLRTSDIIDDLDTQLLHNHPSLVVFDRRNPRHIAGVRQQAATCSCAKKSGKKCQKIRLQKQTTISLQKQSTVHCQKICQQKNRHVEGVGNLFEALKIAKPIIGYEDQISRNERMSTSVGTRECNGVRWSYHAPSCLLHRRYEPDDSPFVVDTLYRVQTWRHDA